MAMSPRLLRPVASGFDPRKIANLAFWLDATDSTTVDTSSGFVTEWRSKVGAGIATQSIANDRPAYTVAGRNGKNVVTFDGTTDWLITGTLSISQPYTIIWAGLSIGSAPNVLPAKINYFTDGTTSGNRVIVLHNSLGTVANNGRLSMFAGTELSPASGVQAYNAWSVVSSVFNGSSSRLRANGTQVASGNAGSGGIAALTLGARFNQEAGNFFDGPWGALLIYSRALSDTECLAVERGLAKSFAITLT
jgi:hypothetical protein